MLLGTSSEQRSTWCFQAFPSRAGTRRPPCVCGWRCAGFVVSGIVTELFGWRWIFLVSVPFILVVLAAAVFLVPSERPAESMSSDLPGSLLLIAAPLLFTLGVVEAGKADSTLPWMPPVALVGAAVAGALFIRVERRSRNPLVPLRFFRSRPRVLANLATALLSAALSTSFLLFTDRLGSGPD